MVLRKNLAVFAEVSVGLKFYSAVNNMIIKFITNEFEAVISSFPLEPGTDAAKKVSMFYIQKSVIIAYTIYIKIVICGN